MAPVRTFPLVQYTGIGLASERPATPERTDVGWFSTDSGILSVYRSGAWSGPVVTLTVVLDGGGDAITTGIKLDLAVEFPCTIQSVTLLADQSGSIVVDVWKDTYANFPPTDADSITASAPPTLSTAAKSQDATLTGWTTSLAAGDILRFNVDSVATVQRVTLALKVERV